MEQEADPTRSRASSSVFCVPRSALASPQSLATYQDTRATTPITPPPTFDKRYVLACSTAWHGQVVPEDTTLLFVPISPTRRCRNLHPHPLGEPLPHPWTGFAWPPLLATQRPENRAAYEADESCVRVFRDQHAASAHIDSPGHRLRHFSGGENAARTQLVMACITGRPDTAEGRTGGLGLVGWSPKCVSLNQVPVIWFDPSGPRLRCPPGSSIPSPVAAVRLQLQSQVHQTTLTGGHAWLVRPAWPKAALLKAPWCCACGQVIILLAMLQCNCASQKNCPMLWVNSVIHHVFQVSCIWSLHIL